jgi:hypothetical protein
VTLYTTGGGQLVVSKKKGEHRRGSVTNYKTMATRRTTFHAVDPFNILAVFKTRSVQLKEQSHVHQNTSICGLRLFSTAKRKPFQLVKLEYKRERNTWAPFRGRQIFQKLFSKFRANIIQTKVHICNTNIVLNTIY